MGTRAGGGAVVVVVVVVVRSTMDTNNLIESIDARGCFRRFPRHFLLPPPVFLLFTRIPLVCPADAFGSICDIISARPRARGG